MIEGMGIGIGIALGIVVIPIAIVMVLYLACLAIVVLFSVASCLSQKLFDYIQNKRINEEIKEEVNI